MFVEDGDAWWCLRCGHKQPGRKPAQFVRASCTGEPRGQVHRMARHACLIHKARHDWHPGLPAPVLP
eukprot:3448442-Amphidinium_carterae.2